MRKLVLLSMLLAACGGAVYVTPPPVTPILQVISPQEAAGIVYAATNTAAAVATQSAYATATESSARSTSTTGARLTQDSLSVLQTQTVLQLTAGAGQALATDAAAVRTQRSMATDLAATPAAAAQRAAVAATATALARQEQAAIRRQVVDEQIAQARGWLLMAVIVVLALMAGAAVVFGVSGLFSAWERVIKARAEGDLAAAERARAEAQQLWVMQYGGRLLQLKDGAWELMEVAQIAAPAGALPPSPSPVREAPYRVMGEVVGTLPLEVAETPERERVKLLLKTAISVAGRQSPVVPSAARLAMHPEDWQKAIDSLKAGPDRLGYVMTRAGRPAKGVAGNTRLCQPAYLTLGALLDGVERGDVVPRPAPAPHEPTTA